MNTHGFAVGKENEFLKVADRCRLFHLSVFCVMMPHSVISAVDECCS